MADIFKFWSGVKGNARIHPKDRSILRQVSHSFDLRCLLHPFGGPLKNARIVLLYLAPGFSKEDLKVAKSKRAYKRNARVFRGTEPLSRPKDHVAGAKWVTSRTKSFGDYETLRSKLAVLELAPYHSKSFHDWPLLAALPSARASLEWAQQVLFPEAIAGKRVVICMRSPKYWGLRLGTSYGRGLFAPRTTRHGHMMRTRMRHKIIQAVNRVLAGKRA